MESIFSALAYTAELLGSASSSALQQVLRRQKLEQQQRKGKKQIDSGKKSEEFQLVMLIPFSKRVAELKTNWEQLPRNSKEWFYLTNERVNDMIVLTNESLAKVQAEDVYKRQMWRQFSLGISAQVKRELPNILACKEELRSVQLPGGYQFQGSVREIWGFQDASDIDLVLSRERPKGFEVVNIVPGFCAIRRLSMIARIHRKYGKSELLKPGRRFTDDSAISFVLSPGKYRRIFSDWRVESSKKLLSLGKLDETARQRIHEHGPAVTHGHCFVVTGKEEKREIDFVCTIRLKSWPWLVKEWQCRHDSCIGLSERVRKASVHVVPIGAYNGATVQSSHAWRYSYNEIECRLVEEFEPLQGAAYALLKKVSQRYLKEAGFKSYHAKTCFLWLQLLPAGRPDNLSVIEVVLAVIELMMRCASKGFMPNYFMPNENVLREAVSPKKVKLNKISDYLESFAESGESLTNLTVNRLRSYIEQLRADIDSTPPPQLNSSEFADCLCEFNDVSGSRLDERCVECDNLNQYRLQKSWNPLWNILARFPTRIASAI